MNYNFKPYDLLVVDEAESVLEDLFSGLCRGTMFEAQIDVFTKLLKTSKKILMLDGFLSNSCLSLCCKFVESLGDIRLDIGNFKTNRGTL